MYGDRRVYTVLAFNQGVSSWISRLPTVWVEGEVTELRRQEGWATVYLTLKDPRDGASVAVTMSRAGFDALRLDLADGMLVHVMGRPELWAVRGAFQLRAFTIETVGEGAVLVRLEQLRRRLAAEGLFAAERKRPLPFLPRAIGLVTGREAAAKHDVIATVTSRFPPAHIIVAETPVQGPRAPVEIAEALAAVCDAGADVVVLARGGGSFDDLLPFSDERLVRAIAVCRVPVVSAVGHEQDTPLCDLAADVRASTPTAAARLVVPDWLELSADLAALRGRLARASLKTLERARGDLDRDRTRLERAPALLLERKRVALSGLHERLWRAPQLLVERSRTRVDALAGRLRALSPAATLDRGYAIVQSQGAIVRSATALSVGGRVDVRVAEGRFAARVEEVEA
jgi:exodeoxyribonuclease VII large subunit